MAAHDELLTLADEYWESVLVASPSFATLLGDRRFDDRIEDLSAEAEDTLRATWTDLLARVDAVEVDDLDRGDRVTHRLLRDELAQNIEGLALRLTELASDQMDGVHAGLLTMTPQVDAPTPESAAALVERHRQIGTLFDQAVERFRAGLAAGRTPARLVIERSLNQLDGYLASDLDDDPFVTLPGPADWDADAEAAWRAQLTEVARDVIRPAFQRYRGVLADELLPVARPDERCGLSWIDDGAAVYRALIHQHTTLADLGAEEIHHLGLAEITGLADEYAVVGERLFGTTDLTEIFDRLRNDPALRYERSDEMMADAQRYLDGARARMGDWFGRLPRSDCDIKPVPEFLAADAPAAYYFPPAADGSRPGAYFVNNANPGEHNRYEMASVAYHEAIPGHHLQLTIANELDELPRFQRFSFGNTAFVEGWALYTERLAAEMGLYANDLEHIGMLAADSWRSARLVVDTGLHALGWSRQQAIDFMVANVPVSIEQIEIEIDRYVAIPGQALAYKVGQLEIRRVRALAAEQRDGDFDIKAFHDVVLGSGSVSLPALRQLVDDWIAAA
ncbi:MAG TPA: DUF885 domain-containing protein [Acidimicrobiales bacterium]|nr:DUF885 domain-containing protein [Acidimicrobiales bacterium]